MPRLPEIREKNLLPEDKRHVFDYLEETRGAVSNGYSVLLNSPEAAGRIAQLGTFIRFESSLRPVLRELAALTASSELDGYYEQGIHTRDLRNLGVEEAVITAVNERTSLDGLSQETALPIRCARELLREHGLSDSTFEEAREQLGDQGVIELIATIGYYSMLAYLHNAIQVRPAV